MDKKMTGEENWTLEDGRFNIRRNAMEYTGETAPWQDCRDDIREAVLEEGISSVPRDAFRDCRNLRSVRFPESVREIGDGAFRVCVSLPEIVIPVGVRRIGEYAFAGCENLKTVIFRGPAPEMGSGALDGVTADVYIPAGDPSWDDMDGWDAGGNITWSRYDPEPASHDGYDSPDSDTGEDASPLDAGQSPTETEERRESMRQNQLEIQEVRRFLSRYDFNAAYAARIHGVYGSDSIRVIRENPYRLAEEIKGIGFRAADRLAAGLGMEKDRDIRLRSGLLYALARFSESGHCFVRREQLLEEAGKILRTDAPALESALDLLLEAADIIQDGDDLYSPEIYQAELGCAENLRRLLSAGKRVGFDPDAALNTRPAGIDYVAEQQDAIRKAADSRVLVLTGGTGTGKTTVIKGILSAYVARNCRVLLAAPTVRAARRLSEATGREARAIPLMLGYRRGGGFSRNEEHPLRHGDVLIVDDCSLMDITMFHGLLCAMPDSMPLVLAGDAGQLPGPGPGNVLNDLIDSGAVPVARLSQIHRRAQGSQITMNAQGIRLGVMPDMTNPNDTNFFFEPRLSDEAIAKTVVQLCVSRLPHFYGADSFRDIQVLSPLRKGVCGTGNLNRLLQGALNPSPRSPAWAGTQIRLGDKVVQTRNSYRKEVYTGDIGRVVQVSPTGVRIKVDYDGRAVSYGSADVDELELAYAVTVHMARGSQFPIVVLPLTMSHRDMLRRDLLYTAVTRAKDAMVMAGSREAVSWAVRDDGAVPRNTKLAARLRA